MLSRFSHKIKKFTTGWLIFVLFLLDGFFMGYLMPLVAKSITNASPNAKLLDLMFFYTPQTAYDMIASYGDAARSVYLNVELSVDVAFTIVYAFFFSLLLTWFLNIGFPNNDTLQKLNLLPFATLLFDLLENLGIATMLFMYPDRLPIVAWLTAGFNLTKWLFAGSVMVLMLTCLLSLITRKFRRRKRRKKSHHSHELRADKDGRIKF